jgi:hypothetical protein
VLRLAFRLAALATVPVLAALPAGCGFLMPGHVGGISTFVSPDDYAERLCAHVELESYPSCASNVLDYFEMPRADDIPGQSTSGPFAVSMDGGLYLGTYDSIPPFVASFRVSNGANGCRGSYNAFQGSRSALFDVYCDDGRAGWADMIRDQGGRNGIGQLTLNDGTKGDIVFGYVPLGQATPFPYTDVWTLRPASAQEIQP